MSLSRACVFLALAACAGTACADIYRYVNAAGVVTFTNMKPTARHEVVIKDKPKGVQQTALITTRAVATPVRGYNTDTRERFAPHVKAAAKATKLDPALIHAVISAESGYNPSARSRAGAVGLMQLMPQTAARYSVTNRFDPAQNIHGGAHYLRDLLHMFNNDLRLALAAYNAGEGAVARYGNRIPPYRETMLYVPKVLGFYRVYRTI